MEWNPAPVKSKRKLPDDHDGIFVFCLLTKDFIKITAAFPCRCTLLFRKLSKLILEVRLVPLDPCSDGRPTVLCDE